MEQRIHVNRPEAIEGALSELRRATMENTGATQMPMRAAVVNIIGYAGEPARAEEMARQVAALAEQHPARAIFLATGPTPGPGAWDIVTAAECHATPLGRLVCFEEVQITARPEALPQLPALVLALLVRDVPVVLWWPGELPAGDALFEQLLSNIDRLLADSASAPRPAVLLRTMEALGHAEHCGCVRRDLNWGRLTPWRDLVAQFFDPSDCRPCLERINHVRLEVLNPAGHADLSQALLLAAWLATRLDWVPAGPVAGGSPGTPEIHLQRGRVPITVQIAALPYQEGPAPGLRSVVLHAGPADKQSTFSIRRSADDAQAEAVTALPDRPARQRVVPFATPSLTDLLAEELRSWGYDAAYREALHVAAYLAMQLAEET